MSLSRRFSRAVAAALTVIVYVFGASAASRAATLEVTSTADSGAGSLRAAIATAASGDTIRFSPALFSGGSAKVIVLTSGPLSIAKELTIDGPGDAFGTQAPMLALDGGGAGRILQLSAQARLKLSGVTLQRGASTSGGAVLIPSGATATFIACDFLSNSASGTAGGGAVLNQGTASFDLCRLESNSAPVGGAIASQGTLRITRSLLTANSATGQGGAIFATGGSVAMESSTVASNTGNVGAGIALVSSGKARVTGSIRASTVASNTAFNQAGGLYVEGSGSTATVGGSIFAYNLISSSSGSPIPRDLATQKSGKISSANYNIVIKPGESLSPTAAQDQVNVDPLLAPLAYNGGRTRTRAIAPGSPAIDRGDPAFAGVLTTTDQRGFPRVAPAPLGRVDVGAFEYSVAQLSSPPTVSFECQGALTPGLITATLTLPTGGTAQVTWTVNGVPAAPSTVVVPAGVGSVTLSHTGLFHDGTNTASVTATGPGFSLSASTVVSVVDTTPPTIVLNGASSITVPLGGAFADPGVVASDLCTPVPAVTTSVNGQVGGAIDTCVLGTSVITYTANDEAGNSATVSRQVSVVSQISITAPGPISVQVDPATCKGAVDLASVVSISGFPIGCSQSIALATTITPPKGDVETLAGLPVAQFEVGTSHVRIEVLSLAGAGAPSVLASAEFDVTVTDPYGVCLPNVVWPHAIEIDLNQSSSDGKIHFGTFQQMIARAGESRWYKFRLPPGARVDISLLNLPANFDLVVYSDIQKAYEELLGLIESGETSDQKLALLGAEFAAEAYSGKSFSPEAYSAEAYSAEAYSAEAYSAEAYSAEAYSAEAYSAEAYSAEAYSAEAYSAEAYSAEAYSAEAYSGAQIRSRIAFSAAPGTLSEGIRFNTYTAEGTFYIRVRGRNGIYSTVEPYDVLIGAQQDLCDGVMDTNTTSSVTPAVSGTPANLLLWDSTRMSGTQTERAELAASLNAFAAVAGGVVVDLGQNARIAALNAQADANPYCPYAKNLVAEAIRQVILAYRTVAPSLSTITLVGPDAAIPFFRTDDEALLAAESNYFPPVLDPTHSQSALRNAQVLTQDRYGSTCEVALSTGIYALPEVPVGRLVETAAEVSDYLDVHRALFDGTVSTGGLLPTPRSLLAVGYDFLADGTEAVRGELSAGLGAGATVDSLIAAFETPPAQGWTASQLRAAFLGTRHDINYLAGHFSTSGALAADYTTRFTAAELAASTTGLTYALVITPGCHSGYNTVDDDAVPLVTEQPDWAQAFARKFATLISGTGYQYGDTEAIEYTERLHVELARILREGSGPVALGRALVDAKNRYLAETPLMRGIHEKALLQVALYGLPMLTLDLPGARLSPPSVTGDIPSTSPILSGPGAGRGLKVAALTVSPTLMQVDETLQVIGTSDTVTASYYTGSDGVVSLPGEPVRPLEAFNLARPSDGLVRGVGFRGGEYSDVGGFIPLTGAAATEMRGVFGRFLCDVFYPARPWNMNQTGELCTANGTSILNVFPAQFLSDGEDTITGTSRRYSRMDYAIYYCPDLTVAALANPPAINIVASSVDAAGAHFAIEVAATELAGVQGVWVTYTGLPGSSLHGRWQSVDLTGPSEASGIGLWTGSLALPAGTASSQVRYMVQAVNGVGAVALNANFGRGFELGASTLDGVNTIGAPTTLTFISPTPTSGVYRETVPVRAHLTDSGGAPIAGARVVFQVGPIVRSATTDGGGVATASLLLNMRPGAYELEAAFAGDSAQRSATAAQAFTVAKRPSVMIFNSAGIVTTPSDVVVVLSSDDGIPLSERTVLFVVTSGGTSSAFAEITDGFGRARLTRPLAGGKDYVVSAYFAQPVTVPGGPEVHLDDALYLPSSATRAITLTNTLTFRDEQAWLNYSDQTAPGAAQDNRGISSIEIAGVFDAADSRFGPRSILAAPKAATVTALVRATLSGQAVVEGTVVLRVQNSGGTQWRGDATINGRSVQIHVDWNSSGATGGFHVWVSVPNGSGPLYDDAPAVLGVDLIFGVAPGEKPAGGGSEIGGADKPWTSENANSRSRTGS